MALVAIIYYLIGANIRKIDILFFVYCDIIIVYMAFIIKHFMEDDEE